MSDSDLVLTGLRGAHLLALISLAGTLISLLVVLPSVLAAAGSTGAVLRTRLLRLAQCSTIAALLCGTGWFAATAVAIAGQGDVAALGLVATETQFGHAMLVRLGLLLTVLAGIGAAPSRLASAAVLAGAALMLQPLFGHPGAAGVGLTVASALHLLAAGVWLGGLVPLLSCVARLPPTVAADACHRFSRLAIAAVVVLAATAAAQGAVLIGGIPALVGTSYGRLALLKLALFALVLGCAAVNRYVLADALAGAGHGTRVGMLLPPTTGRKAGFRRTAGFGGAGSAPLFPALPPGKGKAHRARRWLMLSISAEIALGTSLVLAGAALASFIPAAHQQPVWPFPFEAGPQGESAHQH
jgi:putative copper export protein